MKDELLIMAVTNVDTYIGSKVNGISDLLANYDGPASPDLEKTDAEAVKLSKEELHDYSGYYWNDKYLYTTEISVKDGGVYHSDTDNGFNFQMEPITKTLFLTPFGGTVEFAKLGTKDKTMSNIIPNGRVFDYKEYHPSPVKEGDHRAYLGVYYSEKLESYFRVTWKNGKLVLKRSRKTDLELSSLGGLKFRSSDIDFRLIEFRKDPANKVIAMSISSPSVDKMEFRKIN